MKNCLIVAAFAALAACGSNDAPVDGGPAQQAGVERAAIDPAAAEIAGTYEVTAEDGTVVLQTVNADGTYVETVEGTQTERGIWHQRGERMCFDPAGDTIEQCYMGGQPASDGSFSVETDGGIASVRRVDDAQSTGPAVLEDAE